MPRELGGVPGLSKVQSTNPGPRPAMLLKGQTRETDNDVESECLANGQSNFCLMNLILFKTELVFGL